MICTEYQWQDGDSVRSNRENSDLGGPVPGWDLLALQLLALF